MNSCQQCTATFSRKDNLKRHLEVVHAPDRPQKQAKPAPVVTCTDCGYTFASAQALQVHHDSPTACKGVARPTYTCAFCERSWAAECKYKAHMESRRKYPCKQMFECPLCGHDVSFVCPEATAVCASCDAEEAAAHARGRSRPVWSQPFDATGREGGTQLDVQTMDSNALRVPTVLIAADIPAPQQTHMCQDERGLRRYLQIPDGIRANAAPLHVWFNGTAFGAHRAAAPPHKQLRPAANPNIEAADLVNMDDSAQAVLSQSSLRKTIVSFLNAHERGPTERLLTDLCLDADRRTLADYATASRAFCVHSSVWAAVKEHSRRCTQRQLLHTMYECVRGSPMLSKLEDCFYWLFLSPHARILGSRGRLPARRHMQMLWRDPVPRQRAALTKEQRVLLMRAMCAVTVDDAWNDTNVWKSPMVRHLFEVCKEGLIDKKTNTKLKKLWLPPPKGTTDAECAWVVHPLLSMTGRVRVLSLKDSRIMCPGTAKRDAQMTAYAILHRVSPYDAGKQLCMSSLSDYVWLYMQQCVSPLPIAIPQGPGAAAIVAAESRDRVGAMGTQ
jgi:hypothetical protein